VIQVLRFQGMSHENLAQKSRVWSSFRGWIIKKLAEKSWVWSCFFGWIIRNWLRNLGSEWLVLVVGNPLALANGQFEEPWICKITHFDQHWTCTQHLTQWTSLLFDSHRYRYGIDSILLYLIFSTFYYLSTFNLYL
jgi:hypothetical protein